MSEVVETTYRGYFDLLDEISPIRASGRVTKVVGLVIESAGPVVPIGEMCRITPRSSGRSVLAEVIGFRDDRILLMPLGDMGGIDLGSTVTATGEPFFIGVGESLLGRVIDGLGRPIDGKGPIRATVRRPVHNAPPAPMTRKRIDAVLPLGIRAIDGLLTCCKGQRMAILSGTGVGKSVLLGMIARNTEADVSVIALVGERGREVQDFLERDLGKKGLSRSVVVVATSDQPALIRLKAAMIATTIAEHFRDEGADVILMMDSITRVAMAQREVGLAVGEPPTTRGYTPSVFAFLPRLLERAGHLEHGSITGLYAVLVEGDDIDEPISDAVRAILDGHIVLSRRFASLNHYPAVDILQSVSRVMIDVVPEEHLDATKRVIEILATYRESEDLINIGAYVRGSNPKVDRALAMVDEVNAYLRQGMYENAPYEETVDKLFQLVSR
jgi:flagellum-specific ATP synthase